MKNYSLIVALLLLVGLSNPNIGIAQTSNIDSLENVLNKHTANDTVKVNLLNEIANLHSNNNLKKTRTMAIQAGELADSLSFLKGKAQSLFLLGRVGLRLGDTLAMEYLQNSMKLYEQLNLKASVIVCKRVIGVGYIFKGQMPKALETLRQALELAEEVQNKLEIKNIRLNIAALLSNMGSLDEAIHENLQILKIADENRDKDVIYTASNNLGDNYRRQGNYPFAIEYFHKALKIAEEKNNKQAIQLIYSNIGVIFSARKEYEKALEYTEKSFRMAEELNDKAQIAKSAGQMGLLCKEMKNPMALEYYQKSVKASQESNQMSTVVGSLSHLGLYYNELGEFDKAMPIFYDVLEKSEKIDLKAGIINAYHGLITINIKKKNYTKALHYAQKSLEVSKSMNSVSLNRDIHGQLSIIYAATNDYKNAYQNYKLYKELSDSIDNEENVKKIIELEYTYKFDKEKQAIELEQQKRDIAQAAERKQQQILLFAFFVGFILMFVLFVVIYRSNRNKQKTNIILTQQKHEIEEKNEELLQLNEEILAQKDDILAKNADIELKNSKLQELNATKDKFFGIIAHDLKNPFNAILGYSNLLVASLDRLNPEQTKEYISMVHTSAENAYKLLENLLEWSRAQTGGIDFKPKELLLKPLAFETESLCESLASAKDILIHIEISDDALVYADPNMLNTILRNLITNAIKFTHKGGMVTISSVGQNNATTIKVTDTGVGMDEATKNKLFKIHEKVTAPGTEKESGTGLGLLLCKEFVEKHGGTIWVESEVGKGSSFIFTIPAES